MAANRPRAAVPADGVAWVTGASSGIGRALALELARRGWTVAATARGEEALVALAQSTQGLPGRIIGHAGDVTDAAAMAACVAAVEAAHGPVALAVLNAGIAPYIRAPHIDVAAVQKVFAVNTLGVFNGLAAVMPAMAARGRGQIAVTGSMAGYGGLPKAAAYGGSKAAVIHACEALKFDCDNLGIKLQLVSPGFIRTPLTDENDFPMPFLMEVEEAARRCVDAFGENRFEIVFPRRLAFILKAVNLLPYGLYFPLVARFTGWRDRPPG